MLSAIFRQRKRSATAKTTALRAGLEPLERRDLLTTLSWSAAPDLPAPQTDAAALVAPNNALYLLGGESAASTAVNRLTAGGTSWEATYDLDTQRNDLGAVRAGSAIYVFGGTKNTEGSDEALSYDYGAGDSQDLAPMNRVRYDFGYTADGSGRAYAIGGIGIHGDGEIWSQAERFDPTTNTWAPIAPLPQAVHGMSAIGDGNGLIYVFGGSTTLNDSGIQGTSFAYDVSANSWSTIAPLSVATRDSAAVIDDTGTIFVLGGMSSTGATDAVQVYDAVSDSWTAQTPLPEPVYSHAAAYDSLARITIAGGFDAADTATTAVYRSQRLDVPETAPAITTTAVTDASLDASYTYDVDATGNPAPSYALVTAPGGMSIDSLTGLISWQPITGQLGTHPVTVRASSTAGAVEQAFDVTVVADTIAPTTPTDLAVASTTETSVTLNWTASTDAVGVDHYDVYTVRLEGPRFNKKYVYTLVGTSTTTTATITGLTPLSSASYSVDAVDAAGNRSGKAAKIIATTQSVPTLSFRAGTQTTGTIQSPAKHPLEIQLLSAANPAATFSLVSGPAGVLVNSTSGLVTWTPAVADVGLHTVTFRAANSVGSTDLDVSIEILADAPQLSVEYNPTTGGERFALAGTLFTAQIHDASSSPSTFALVTAPAGMTVDASTGLISWTAAGEQGGTQAVTVRATNSGGTTDLAFDVLTLFTGPVSNVAVTDTTQLEPTASWVPPTGEGAGLVASYQIKGSATWGVGRTEQTHRVSYSVPASETSVLMTGLVTGKSYTLTVTPVDAAGNLGLGNTGTTFVSSPALPVVRWWVNGRTGGSSVPGTAIAEQPTHLVLSDSRPDPSTLTLVSGPAGLTFDPVTQTADWTPSVADVTTGYTTTSVTFQATNSVGSVDVVVPVRVFFTGAVRNVVAIKNSTYVATATWDPPSDNATPVVGHSITRHWTWSGRPRSVTWTVGNVTSLVMQLYPTGAVSHKGVTITPIDANGNLGVSSGKILFGSGSPPPNNAPVPAGDSYFATANVTRTIDALAGVLANDTDADGDALTASVIRHPANGSLSLSADGSFSYTPHPGYLGPDDFIYVANDGSVNSRTATVAITVQPPPTADILLTSATATGADELELTYEIVDNLAGGFDVGFYRSPDAIAETADELLDTVTIDQPADLTPGPHTITLSLGTGPGQLMLPGAGAAETDSDYYLLAIADPSDVVAETDSDAIGEDNSAAVTGVYHLPGGDILVQGTDVADTITIDAITVGTQNLIKLTAGGRSSTYARGDVSGYRIRTHAGNDTVEAKRAHRAVWAFAGAGDDTVKGGPKNDRLDGQAGLDKLYGRNGSDTLLGGPGNDRLMGGNGADSIDGGADNDILQGQYGNDTVAGGDGVDTWYLDGTGANEVISVSYDTAGGNLVGRRETAAGLQETYTAQAVEKVSVRAKNGNDTIDLTALTDAAFAAAGLSKAYLDGGSGVDRLLGSGGADVLWGRGGNDELFGGLGNDLLRGGGGNDVLNGGFGNDRMLGDAGRDRIRVTATSGNDNLRAVFLSATKLQVLRRDRGVNKVVERDTIFNDADDLLSIFALAGDDIIAVPSSIAIGGSIDGGAGTDTATAPPSWTKINTEG